MLIPVMSRDKYSGTGPFLWSPLSGWISALTCLNTSIAVGIIMILIAGLFTALAVMSLVMFKKVGSSGWSAG